MADQLDDQGRLLESEVALTIIDWLSQEVPALVNRRIAEVKPVVLEDLSLTVAQRLGIKTLDIHDDRLRIVTADGQEHILDRVVGRDGRSINSAQVNDDGELVLDIDGLGETIVGRVVGRDGRGIDGVSLHENGNLTFLFDDGNEISLGNIKGRDGDRINEIVLDDNGNLKVSVASAGGASVEYVLGPVVGQAGRDGKDGTDGAQGKPGRAGAKGDPGRGIQEVRIDKLTGNLLVEYDDGVLSDCGFVGNGNVLGARVTKAGILKIRVSGRDKEISAGVINRPFDQVPSPGFVWRGEFRDGLRYSGSPDGLSDVVSYNGSTYICMGETGVAPPSSPWELMAKGADELYMPLYSTGGMTGGGGGGGDLPPGVVMRDGSVPFIAPQGGVTATGPTHLTTKAQMDAAVAGVAVPAPATTLPRSPGTAAVGTATKYAREDHIHPSQPIPNPSDATPSTPGAAAPGTSFDYARADHTHPAQTVPSAATNNPANLGTAAVGTSARFAREDHVHELPVIPAPATATPNAPGVAAVGTATKYAREDHTHAAQDLTPYVKADGTVSFTGQITVPDGTTSTKAVNKGQLDAAIGGIAAPPTPATAAPLAPGSAAVGVATKYAREDHVHPAQTVPTASNATPQAPGTAAAGTSADFSRADHVHAPTNLTGYVKADGSVDFTGQITVPNGTTSTKAVNKGQLDAVSGAIPAAATATPQAPGSAAVGVATKYAREDHVHPAQTVPTASNATPQAEGTAAAGTSPDFARADHVHPAQTVPTASNATPQPLGTAAAGSSADFSRADHVHVLPTIPGPATVAPLAAGTATVGTTTKYAREDHIHPAQDLTPYIKKDGSVDFTGQITVPDGTTATKAINKGQLDAAIAGVTPGSVAAYSIMGRGSTSGVPGALPSSADMGALIAAANYAAARTLLSLVVGTNVQAQNALLQLLSALTASPNTLVGFNGSTVGYLQSILALAQTLLASNDPIVWRNQINRGVTALTDATTIATDCSLGNVFSVTLGGNRTLGNPTNVVAGATYIWMVTQGSGGQTLALGSNFKLGKDASGADITFTASTGAGLTDTITAVAKTTTNLIVSFQKGAA